MITHSIFKQKGITLIELLITLVISGMVIAGTYRIFVAQSKAYTVQDQVVEVQQNTRSAMEILLRDLRMTGFDSDDINSKITIANAIIIGADSITVNYEYDNTTQYTVAYWFDAPSQTVRRQLSTTKDDGSATAGSQDVLLDNVEAFNLTYGIDTNDDGGVERWVDAGAVGLAKVIAVQVRLTARPPKQENEDVQKMVYPRTLESTVTLRNLCLNR